MNAIDRLKSFRNPITALQTRKTLKIGAWVLLGAALVLCVTFLTLRNSILKSVINNKIHTYQNGHEGAEVSIGTARFSGLDCIVLENIRLSSETGPFAIDLRSCYVTVSIRKMLVGQVRPKHFEMNDLTIDLRQDSLPEYSFDRLAGIARPNQDRNRELAYSARIGHLLDLFFTRIPDYLEINRFTINSDIDRIQQTFHVPRLIIDGLNFETTVEIDDQGKVWACNLAGDIDQRNRLVSFRVLPLHPGEKIGLPFINRQWGVRISFDSFAIRLKSSGLPGGSLQLDGLLAVSGLALNYPRIAAEDVYLQNVAVDYAVHIGADFLELDRRTRFSFNKLSFHPYLKFKSRPAPQLTLEIDTTEFKADDFFLVRCRRGCSPSLPVSKQAGNSLTS